VQAVSLINNGGFGFCVETIQPYVVGIWGGGGMNLAGNDNKKYVSDVHVSLIFHAKFYLSSLRIFRTVRSKNVTLWRHN
jgi:hypothetical protein